MYIPLNKHGAAVAANVMDKDYAASSFNQFGFGVDLRVGNLHLFGLVLQRN